MHNSQPERAPALAPAQVEGTCNGEFGFILGVLGITDTGRGLLREGTGAAVFNLKYSCICFKPFKGEVMDVVVTSVNKARRRRGPGPGRPLPDG